MTEKIEMLYETMDFNKSKLKMESITETRDGEETKHHYLEGLFIQGEVKNYNERIYPRSEIASAVRNINEQIQEGHPPLGEMDHPANLQINLDRVTHMVTEMKMRENDGIGKLKIIPTPMGEQIITFLKSGVPLGVSSRGTGEVDPSGHVRNFEIVTVDIVAQPSAPGAYPTAIYEHLQRQARLSNNLTQLIEANKHDPSAQVHLEKVISSFIATL